MSSPSNRAQWTLATLCFAVLGLLFGLWAYHNVSAETKSEPVLVSATLFEQPRALNDFMLTDANKKNFTMAQLKGHWNMIFFGFTHCPDLCPTTLSTLNQAYNKLQDQGQTPMPQVVFISVDPERDDPTQIKKYLSSFNPHFLGATGSEKQLKQLSQELSVIYAKILQPDNKNYTIDHSGTILLINPQGQFAGVFTLPHDANKIAQDLKTILASTEAPEESTGKKV